MTLEEFKRKFEIIKNRGFIKSIRKGPTGIGHTLESLLGLKENNLALPDIGDIELKTHRDNSNSLITLFTFNKNVWKMRQLDAIKRFGYIDGQNRPSMYYTLSLEPNDAGLYMAISKKELLLKHICGTVIASWKLSDIIERFAQKIPALLFVSACTEKRSDGEYFHFYKAQLMREASLKKLSDLLKLQYLLVDLRLHAGKTSVRNHGTGFRVFENKLSLLFKKVEEI